MARVQRCEKMSPHFTYTKPSQEQHISIIQRISIDWLYAGVCLPRLFASDLHASVPRKAGALCACAPFTPQNTLHWSRLSASHRIILDMDIYSVSESADAAAACAWKVDWNEWVEDFVVCCVRECVSKWPWVWQGSSALKWSCGKRLAPCQAISNCMQNASDVGRVGWQYLCLYARMTRGGVFFSNRHWNWRNKSSWLRLKTSTRVKIITSFIQFKL
jgi:hypothetical protein